MFSEEKRNLEVPESKSLAPDVETIKASVCKRHDIEEEVLTVTRRGITNEPRNVPISWMRHLRGDSLEEVGREFKVAKYSPVSSTIERMKARIGKDRKLRTRLVRLKEKINMNTPLRNLIGAYTVAPTPFQVKEAFRPPVLQGHLDAFRNPFGFAGGFYRFIQPF